MLERVSPRDPFGDVCVVSREGFLRLKELTGRARDRADIERLSELADRVDDVSTEGRSSDDGGSDA
ncbi:MAG: hypothetical protein IT175_12425 [Acidobacteria bacterium]|nr:hypothetical protein [Acidobacteriota bacterium]